MKKLSIAVIAGAVMCLSTAAFAGSKDAKYCVAYTGNSGKWDNFTIVYAPNGVEGHECKFDGVRVRLWKDAGKNGDSITRCIGTRTTSRWIGFKPEKTEVWKDNDQDCK